MNRSVLRMLRGLVWLVAILCAWKLRWTVVSESQASAGDGLQYFQLTQTIKLFHRFAYLPSLPLTFTRLPGYPLFLALIQPARMVGLEEHLIWASRANVMLDLATALLVAAIGRRLRMGQLAQLLGFAAVIVSPPLFMLSTHALSEPLVTCLLTLAVYLALWAKDAQTSGAKDHLALLTGFTLGLAQLVRVDSLLVIPAVLLLLWLAATGSRQRLRLWALCLGVCSVTFAPWPLRNLRLFGSPHFGGSPWIDQDGSPLRLGMMRWYQTWATGRTDGEGFDLFLVARHAPLPPTRPNVITPLMYDDAAERSELVQICSQYSQEGLSPAVDKRFYRLALRRLVRHPFRVLVVLPLRRLVTLWSPMPPYEMGIRSALLHLPDARERWDRFGSMLLLLSLAGACFALSEPGKRRWVAALWLVPVLRSGAFVYLHPIPLQRYFVEALPIVLLFSGYALAWPIARLQELLSVMVRRSDCSEPSL